MPEVPTPAIPSSVIPVVRIITRLNIGGPSIQACTLSDRLDAHGFRTRLVHGRLGAGEGDMRYLLEGTRVQDTYMPDLQRPLAPAADARALRQIYRVLCDVRPAIVHTHMAKAGTLGRTATLLYNRTAGRHRPARLVHTYHGHVLEGYFDATKTAVFLNIERLLARATDRVVSISPRIKAELLDELRIGSPSQYVVIPLGFDLEGLVRIDESARAAARAALNVSPDVDVVTTLGRLTAIKQHDLFLDMARLVVARCPTTQFLIVGDGELRPSLEQQVTNLGLGAHVRFLGWRRDLDTIYAATDVFALTSRNEGTPVALIEAMAAGVPGVSTDVGGVGDVIDSSDVGTRVASANAAALADAVITLLQSPHRAAIGARARTLVRERFGIDRLVRDIAELYRTMLAHSGK
jgi:glycosyltransferase involved in cell wall biosynthesis